MSTSPPSRTKLQLKSDPRANFPTIVAVGRRLAPHEDFYHWVLTRTWLQFFGAVTLAFAMLNILFACIYMLSPGCIDKADGFADHFFFSVQTLGTIGYGSMAPQTRYGNVIVSLEALTGILTTAVITGLTFARFARPTSKILFSDKMVMAKRDGVPHLMFRMANWRRNQIVEAQLNVLLLVTERTAEGEMMRRPLRLELVRDRNPMFALSWTAMHKIDENSPFYGDDALSKLKEQNAEIFLTLSGLDETLMQTITARWRYALDDIVQNARFADVLVTREDGTRVIDYDKFHDIVRME
jgi:inward rectifier potassium channel